MLLARYKADYIMGPVGNRFGTGLEQVWNRFGTGLVCTVRAFINLGHIIDKNRFQSLSKELP